MKTSVKLVTALAAVMTLMSACGQEADLSNTAVSQEQNELNGFTQSAVPAEIQNLPQVATADRCDHRTAPGIAHCYARVRVNSQGMIAAAATPSGLTPTDIRDAYKVPSTGGSGVTVAIVDAQDDPNAESDLAVYRSQYGLPPCTTANGCFKKLNQNGVQGSYPAADSGWAGEIALDLEMVSAACPNCKIILVEATTASMANLGTAVNTAVAAGANVVSNSYGGSEDSSITTADTQYFNHPGIAIMVSSGDDGYGVEYPASSKFVTAVGGTTLTRSSGTSRGWVESVWGSASNSNGGAGSGCSKYISKPSWQHDTGCTKRMVADVSAVADPATGVAVYDSYGSGGWAVYGGTSVASPVVAAIYAATGHASSDGSYSYSNPSAFFDVTSGTNGSCSSSTPYFCKAGTGYDGPTGNGSPNGAVMAGGGTTTNDFSISLSPSSRTTGQGTTTTYTVATTLASGTAQSIALSVSGLPSGITGSFSPASVTAGGSSTLTLTISSSAAATTTNFTVTGAGSSATHTTSGSITVTGSGGGTCSTNSQLLLNPGFESGNTSWTASSGVIYTASSSAPSHAGSYLAYLDGYGTSHTDTLYQTITIPSGACTASLSFWLRITTSETTTSTAYDTLTVQIQNSSGTVLGTLATYSNLNKSSSYAQKTFNLSAYKGQTIRVYFKGVEDSTLATSFFIDDTALDITQ